MDELLCGWCGGFLSSKGSASSPGSLTAGQVTSFKPQFYYLQNLGNEAASLERGDSEALHWPGPQGANIRWMSLHPGLIKDIHCSGFWDALEHSTLEKKNCLFSP